MSDPLAGVESGEKCREFYVQMGGGNTMNSKRRICVSPFVLLSGRCHPRSASPPPGFNNTNDRDSQCMFVIYQRDIDAGECDFFAVPSLQSKYTPCTAVGHWVIHMDIHTRYNINVYMYVLCTVFLHNSTIYFVWTAIPIRHALKNRFERIQHAEYDSLQ